MGTKWNPSFKDKIIHADKTMMNTKVRKSNK